MSTTTPSLATLERLSSSRACWLTTLRPDGSPHTTPVWFVFDGSRFWIASARSNVKVRNLASDARMSVAIDGSANAPLVAQGNAELLAPRDVNPLVLTAFSAKYDGWNVLDDAIDGERVLISMRIERWLLAS